MFDPTPDRQRAEPLSTSSGDLYVPDYEFGVVNNTAPDPVHIADFTTGAGISGGTSPGGVAVNPTNGNVYVANNVFFGGPGSVSIFDPQGNLLTSFPTLGNPTGCGGRFER